jgi:uncharacterized protein (DUF433 family)
MTEKNKDKITTDPNIMTGKPIIKGTRITVATILRQLAQGVEVDEILQNYPTLKKEDIQTALEYATDRVEEERVYPLTD